MSPSRTLRTASACVVAAATLAPPAFSLSPDVVRPVTAVPPEIAGRFREPGAFQRAASGQYFVFDRRGHTVYGLDAERSSAWDIVHIGAEPGRIIEPTAMSVAPDGTFAVADAPGGRQRVQIFTPAGFRTAGFILPDRARPRVLLNDVVVGGIGSLQYTGTMLVLSLPETGALVRELTLDGRTLRAYGALRPTGHEEDEELHLALNTGLPLVTPDGGTYFVFQTGEPVFRKYDAEGHLVFERRIQGREIDELVGSLPTEWRVRRRDEGEIPFVPPTVLTAAVDRDGRLWVSFAVPYTYVFDADGDKVRVVEFRGAGTVSPRGMFFDDTGWLLVTPGLYVYPTGP